MIIPPPYAFALAAATVYPVTVRSRPSSSSTVNVAGFQPTSARSAP